MVEVDLFYVQSFSKRDDSHPKSIFFENFLSNYMSHMHTTHLFMFGLEALALAIPILFVASAVLVPSRATWTGIACLGVAVALAFGSTLGSILAIPVPFGIVTCIMLTLVCSLAAVILRYSSTYLHGDPGIERYLRWMLMTLGAVSVVVIADNLLLLAVGWTATSLTLHQLLTFFSDRTEALIAAQKKFIVSRLADGAFGLATVLVFRDVGSVDFATIGAWADANPQLTPTMHVAAVLVVLAVALRSAQIPFHGWLTQVMEAPTPVSALLHAGIVNIGGLVLIRLSPWLNHADVAMLMLVGIGLTSAVIGSLVMTTRVSVKVGLAWSTCAQMGFMLVQCGLGLWSLALLHLVAHSLYKAHRFLSAGTAVDTWRLKSMTPAGPAGAWSRRLGVGLLAVGAGGSGWMLQGGSLLDATDDVAVFALILGASMVPLLAGAARQTTPVAGVHVARALAVVGLYAVWHRLAGHMVPTVESATSSLGWVVVGLGFSALFLVTSTVRLRPHGVLARGLYPWLFAGFYLDEAFTRMTFRIWPPHFEPRRPAGWAPAGTANLEARS